MKYLISSNPKLRINNEGLNNAVLLHSVSELKDQSESIDSIEIFNELEMCENPAQFLQDLHKSIPDYCFVSLDVIDPYDVINSILRGNANLEYINNNWINLLKRKLDLPMLRELIESNGFTIDQEDVDVGVIMIVFHKNIPQDQTS